jgi:hypothetical protein
MNWIKYIFGLLCFFIVFGCTPSKRIARIAEKYNLKQYEDVIFRDTLYIEEKTYIFETKIDSFGYFYQNTTEAKIDGYIKDSIIQIKIATKLDTIYIEKPVKIETIKVNTVEKSKIPLWFLMFFAFTVILMWIFYVFRDKQNSK